MGDIASTFESVADRFDTYFILIGHHCLTPIKQFFDDHFYEIASRLGERATIIRQTPHSRIVAELDVVTRNHPFKDSVDENFFDIVSRQHPGLLILKRHPKNLTENDAIVYISHSALNEAYKNNHEELLTDLVGFTLGKRALLVKTNKWMLRVKKVSSRFSFGLPVGPFAINFNPSSP